MNTKRLSKFLSLVLRHNPKKIDLKLDDQGWAEVSHLLERLSAHGKPTTRSELEYVVENNDKKRFTLSDDAKALSWFTLSDLPELAFNHNTIITDATKHLTTQTP